MDGILYDLIFDYTLRTVALGSGVLGLVSGALGCFAVLRRQSLMGDAMSHAALPGIVIAFMLTGMKTPLVLVIGAALAGWLGTLKIMSIVNLTRLKHDAAMALVLSVFFGLGLVLLTFIQKTPQAAQAGLENFLFGQAAALMVQDVIIMAIIGLITLVILAGLWKRFKLLSFDVEYGQSMGIPMRILDIILTGLLVLAIVIGLQTVGVVLMSAMIVAPAAAARQWTDKLGVMVFLAAIFGAASGISGAVVSSTAEKLPTGPTIVLCVSGIVFVSLLFAPNRGIIWNKIRRNKNRRKLRLDAVICDLYSLALQHDDFSHAHDTATLIAMSPGQAGIKFSLEELERRELVKITETNQWVLTEKGIDEAKLISSKFRGQNN
ncbi:MAG: metal ABC transporter permease [Candidatus Zixiibacteriota bacterium]